MEDDIKWWQATLILGVIFIGGFFLVKWISSLPPAPAYVAPVVEEKPLTKTRCDITGWASSSIIEEEAANGYRFTGRMTQILCENSLSFELKEQQ